MFRKPIEYVPPNKKFMVGILLAEKALLKSPYLKRYEQF